MLPAAAIMGWVLSLLAHRPSGERVPFGGYMGVFSIGVAVCYAVGTAWFAVLYASGTGTEGIAAAFLSCVLPYLLPDVLKCLIAARLCCRLQGRRRG
jgi:biotin transporter BioY